MLNVTVLGVILIRSYKKDASEIIFETVYYANL